jgi:hypothetical protein
MSWRPLSTTGITPRPLRQNQLKPPPRSLTTARRQY